MMPRMIGQLVHDLGLQRHVLADLDAGDVRGDRLELAADLGRGVRLHVVAVDVRRPAAQPDHDDRLAAAGFRGRGGRGGAARRPASARRTPARPTRINSRRVMPSHNLVPRPRMLNMAELLRLNCGFVAKHRCKFLRKSTMAAREIADGRPSLGEVLRDV